MTKDTIHTIQEELFPLCSLITPNLSEASLLLARTVTDVEDMKQAARELADRYHCAVLVKGGHLSGTTMCDVLYGENGFSLFEQQKIESCNLHGTGCTLSSAIATLATCNNGLEDASVRQKLYRQSYSSWQRPAHRAWKRAFMPFLPGGGMIAHLFRKLHN